MSINIQGKPLKEWVEEQKKKEEVVVENNDGEVKELDYTNK